MGRATVRSSTSLLVQCSAGMPPLPALLLQMYIGDGAKMVRDAFDLAKEKGKTRGGAIIFIDEVGWGGKGEDAGRGHHLHR